MKMKKLLAICLIMILAIACCIFTSCGADLAASAGGIYNSDTSEEQDAEEPEASVEDASGVEAEDEDIALEAEALNESEADVMEYVLNTNTKKFHYPDCRSVKQMKDKNKLVEEATREDIMARGYEPCQNCNP